MLKTKLHKAGFIITSFMLMAAASGTDNSIPGEVQSVANKLPGDSLAVSKHVFDTAGLCTCLPEMSEAELEKAPRIQLAEEARSFVSAHLKENAFYYNKLREKSVPVFGMIDKVFSEYNIPQELKYLAVVESKLDSRIISSAGAAGLWQFMPGAAKSFGLHISGKNDERRNNYKSTVAAAKCLIYLHGIFDDWLLTLAAYNSGPAKVLGAIKKSGSRNFWVLERYLAPETRKHVKKFISVHYYFEGHGSLATMTKAETTAHTNAVAVFSNRSENNTDSIPVTAEIINK
jgi:membrane-bound lytic murein transglycosylase D